MEQLMFTEEKKWVKFETSHVKSMTKFLLYEDKETKDRLLLCGAKPKIRYHKDLVAQYEGSLESFQMIGAGSLLCGFLESLSSSGYKYETSRDVAIDIIKYLGEPFMGSAVQSFMDSDREYYP